MSKSLTVKGLTLLCSVVGYCLAQQALAQDNSQKALARVQYMLKQINAEKAQLEVKNANLMKEIEALKQEMDEKLSSEEKKKNKLKNTLDNWKEEYNELRGRFIATSKQLRQTTEERNISIEKFTRQTENYKLCYAHNKSLVAVNEGLLAKFYQKGVWDAISQKEPITGLGKVAIENLVQKYKFEIEDLDLELNDHLIKNVDIEQGQDLGRGLAYEQ